MKTEVKNPTMISNGRSPARLLATAVIFMALSLFSFTQLHPQDAPVSTGSVNKSSSSTLPLELTWIDLAFAHFYPLQGTRLDDFSDVNYGGAFRLNFMLFGIEPLWLSGAVMAQRHVPAIDRIQTLTDYGFSVGGGWRFAFSDFNFHNSYLNRWYFTPRFDYGIMLHVTYGDYYDDPDIYPGDPRAGEVKTRYFTDQYQMLEFELAYDLSPTLRNTSWGRGVQSEVFLSPSVIYFPETDRDGWEYGYLLGIRIKGDISAPPSTLLSGRVVDADTGQVFEDTIPSIEGENLEKAQAEGTDTFAYKVDPEKNYTLAASREGYEVATVSVQKDELEPEGRKTVIIELRRRVEWGIYGNVYIKDTAEPIYGVKITALERKEGEAYAQRPKKGSDKVIPLSDTNETGDFRLQLKKDTDYDILLEKDGYFTMRGDFTTREKAPGWYPVKEYMNIMLQASEVGAKIDFDNIYYDTGKWNIRKESERVLNQMTQFMRDNPKIVVELSAHTDSRGGKDSNRTLSQKRAQSAVDYIVNAGIPRERIAPKGYGEDKILNRCVDGVTCSAAEHQSNRRTEFRVRRILD